MGIGTDIGGSIVSGILARSCAREIAPGKLYNANPPPRSPQRVPAAYMGLYGLKGSVGRMPHAGLLGSHDGMDAIVGALGPLATSARDLALFCRTMLQYEPWLVEPPLLEIPWRQELVDGAGLPERLSIAILWDDGVVAPHPPIVAALARARDALLAAGHDVLAWEPVEHQDAWELIVRSAPTRICHAR